MKAMKQFFEKVVLFAIKAFAVVLVIAVIGFFWWLDKVRFVF